MNTFVTLENVVSYDYKILSAFHISQKKFPNMV